MRSFASLHTGFFLFTGEFPTDLSENDDGSQKCERQCRKAIVVLAFFVAQKASRLLDKYYLRKAEIRMRSKRSKKTNVMRKAAQQPARLRYVKRKEALNCLGRQRQKFIYRVAHRRGC